MRKIKFIATILASGLALLSTMDKASVAHALDDSVAKAIVQIEIYDSSGDWYTGTGFFIDEKDSTVITNAHVIMDKNTKLPARNIFICTIKSETSVPDCQLSARVLEYNEDIDLALLVPAFKLDENYNEIGSFLYNFKSSSVGAGYLEISEKKPSVGDTVQILGFPAASLSRSLVLTRGAISSLMALDLTELEGFEELDPEIDETEAILGFVTDATINPGNSGGPVLDAENKVMGIVSAYSTSGVGGNYGYVISSTTLGFWSFTMLEKWGLTELLEAALVSGDTSALEAIPLKEILDKHYPKLGYKPQKFRYISPFSDVPWTHPNGEAISYLKYLGVINGYEDGSFRPADNLNRAELLKILMEGMGYRPSLSEYSNCFPDVKTEWFAPYVCFAKSNSWIEGYADGTFRPAANVNKVEGLKMLLEVFDVALSPGDYDVYSDVPANQWFTSYIVTAKNLGLLEEEGFLYSPAANMTRSGISENLYRLLLVQ